MTSLKLISINTWKCDGDYFTRMRVMAKQLKQLQPDIIACQECFQSSDGNIDTLSFLAKKLTFQEKFTAARCKERAINDVVVNSFSGLGILSRFPITSYKEIELPTSPADGGRKAQFVVIKPKLNYSILLVNVHLTHLRNDVELRKAQIKAISNEILNSHYFDTTLLCGDFNAAEDSTEIQLLRELLQAKSCNKRNIPEEELTTNSFQIRNRVDHIFALPDKNKNYPECSGCESVMNQADIETGLFASDHSGVMTIFSLPSKKRTSLQYEKSQSAGY